MADATMYAWSTIYNGGEVEMVRDRKVIHSRNIVPPGEKVSQASLKVDDDTWQALVDGGSVRPYKFPDIPANFDGSVSDYILGQMRDEDGEVSQDMILALAMTVHGETVEGDKDVETIEAEVETGAKK